MKTFEKLEGFLIALLVGVIPFGSFTVLSLLNLDKPDAWFFAAISAMMFLFFSYMAYLSLKDVFSNQ